MSTAYSYPGIAAATGTRVDSAAKHTLACKVSEPLMMCWCGDQRNARNTLHNQKDKYCMFKNDLVINVSQPLNDTGTIISTAKAYPAVVSNLGDMTSATKNIICKLYAHGKTGSDFMNFQHQLRGISTSGIGKIDTIDPGENSDRIMREIKDLPYFRAQGFSLGTAYASNLSGDTVGTVLIGGMCTVQNGAFECRAGEMVQWYFEFEQDMFYMENTEDRQSKQTLRAGSRKDVDVGLNFDNTQVDKVKKSTPYKETPQEIDRKQFYERALGDDTAFPKNYKKHNVAYPKPFKLCKNGNEHYADKIRIFAKCVNGARKHEMIDLMLMTQST